MLYSTKGYHAVQSTKSPNQIHQKRHVMPIPHPAFNIDLFAHGLSHQFHPSCLAVDATSRILSCVERLGKSIIATAALKQQADYSAPSVL
jgi:hypothetical protein